MQHQSENLTSKSVSETPIKLGMAETDQFLPTERDTSTGNGSDGMHATNPAEGQAAATLERRPADHADSMNLAGEATDLKHSTTTQPPVQADEAQPQQEFFSSTQTAEQNTSENPEVIQENAQDHPQPDIGHQNPRDHLEVMDGDQANHPLAPLQLVRDENREELPRANIQIDALPIPIRLDIIWHPPVYNRLETKGYRNTCSIVRISFKPSNMEGLMAEEIAIHRARNRFNLWGDIVEDGYRELSKYQIAERMFGDGRRLPLHDDVVLEFLMNRALFGRISNFRVFVGALEDMNRRADADLEANIGRQFMDDPLDENVITRIRERRHRHNADAILAFINLLCNRAEELGLNEEAMTLEKLWNEF